MRRFTMHNYPRLTINRHSIILMPKQPVLDWIKRVDSNPPNLTLDQLRLEQNAFLVSEIKENQMATYEQIRSDMRSSTGKTMQNCWIAHVRELNGLAPRAAANRKSFKERVKPCPDHMRPMIEASM